jgi:cytochrome c biogenesis protein CcdA
VPSATLGFAFAAGLVAALNPCGFAMLPAYLALVVRGEGDRRGSAVWRALTATVAMSLGFIAVFGTFGFLAVSAANVVQAHLPYVTLAVGSVLAAAGLWLLFGRALPAPSPRVLGAGGRWAPTARLGSMFGYGLGYALASLSCTIGPFLAVTGIGVSGSAGGLSAFLAYTAGFAVIVGTLAMATALASSALVDRMRTVLPHLSRISGAILLLVGAYVGYYGWYELRLRASTAAPVDPVIVGAGRLQGALAGWVFDHGPWPWVGAVGALLVVASLTALGRRRAGLSGRVEPLSK